MVKIKLISLALAASANANIDTNGNDVCDFWEYLYQGSSLVASDSEKESDYDGDGVSNYLESIHGTDPRDASSQMKVFNIDRDGLKVTFQFNVQDHKSYQIYGSGNLRTWNAIGSPIAPNAGQEVYTLTYNTQAPESKFYYVKPIDSDSDNDGLSDWIENQLPGYSPDNSDSFGIGYANSDYDALENQLAAMLNDDVSIRIPEGYEVAYEKEYEAALFQIRRSDPTYPYVIFLESAADATAPNPIASEDDYTLKYGNIALNGLNGSFIMPAGKDSVNIQCVPAQDTTPEVPESLTLGIKSSNSFASVMIQNAKNTPENQQLFVAQFDFQSGADVNTYGSANLIVNGALTDVILNIDSDSSQTGNLGHHLFHETTVGRLEFSQNYPRYTYDMPIPIESNDVFSSDQSFLDAIFNEDLNIRVLSDSAPTEILANFINASARESDSIIANSPAPVEEGDWGRVRLYGHSYNNNGYNSGEYEFIRQNFSLHTIEKRHDRLGYGLGTSEFTTRLTAEVILDANPNTDVLFYWNAHIAFADLYESLVNIPETNPTWFNSETKVDGSIEYTFNFEEAGMRNYWVNKANAQVNNTEMAGVFVDAIPKAEVAGQLDEVHDLMDRLSGTVIYNGYRYSAAGFYGGAETLDHADGVFVEAFLNATITTSDAAVSLIDELLLIPSDKYIICNGVSEGFGSNGTHHFSLAAYLIIANDKSYYRYGDGANFHSKYMTYWHSDFAQELGAPLGDAQKNGYIYTRSFEHAEVVIDFQNQTSSITWM